MKAILDLIKNFMAWEYSIHLLLVVSIVVIIHNIKRLFRKKVKNDDIWIGLVFILGFPMSIVLFGYKGWLKNFNIYNYIITSIIISALSSWLFKNVKVAGKIIKHFLGIKNGSKK